MQNKESKPCNRKNCLYYGMTLCPYRMVCEYSVLSTWTERKRLMNEKQGNRTNF